VANKERLYNFLSTFSGTHYVSPRTFPGDRLPLLKQAMQTGAREGFSIRAPE
jgi:hypothetical protein